MSLGIYGYKDFFINDNFALFSGGGYTANFFYTPLDINQIPEANKAITEFYKGDISNTIFSHTARLELGMSYQTTENSTLELSLFRKFILDKDITEAKESFLKNSLSEQEMVNELTNWGINLGIRFKF